MPGTLSRCYRLWSYQGYKNTFQSRLGLVRGMRGDKESRSFRDCTTVAQIHRTSEVRPYLFGCLEQQPQVDMALGCMG